MNECRLIFISAAERGRKKWLSWNAVNVDDVAKIQHFVTVQQFNNLRNACGPYLDIPYKTEMGFDCYIVKKNGINYLWFIHMHLEWVDLLSEFWDGVISLMLKYLENGLMIII